MRHDKASAALYRRQQKGAEIAAGGQVQPTRDDFWVVPSQSHAGSYLVDMVDRTCTCPDQQENHGTCKHIHAVLFTRLRAVKKDGIVTVFAEDTVRVSYPQDWPNYNKAQCHEKEHVQVLLRGLCDGVLSRRHS